MALRAYRRDPIGLVMDAQGANRTNTIIAEGVNSIEEFVDLHLDKGMKTLCANVRKSAGTIPNPGWNPPILNPNTLVAPQILVPGQQTSTICEQRLTLTAYGATLHDFISRPIETANLTRARLCALVKSHVSITTNTFFIYLLFSQYF